MNLIMPLQLSRLPRVAKVVLRRTSRRIRQAIPATALIIMLLLAWSIGGASRSNTTMIAVLEMVAIGLVALVRLTTRPVPSRRPARLPWLVILAFAAVSLLQLVPIPWQIWASLPGRSITAAGLELLGLGGGFRPLSLAPENTLSGLLQFIPPLAVFWIATQLAWRVLIAVLAWVALAIGVASTLWAAGQVLGLAPYLYAWTDPGMATGPFANPNHQASLLLMIVPLIAVMAGQARQNANETGGNGEAALLWSAAALFSLVGVFAAGSLFGYMFFPFVLAASALIGAGDVHARSWRMIGAGIAASVVVFATIGATLGLDQLGEGGDVSAQQSRSAISGNTIEAIQQFAPAGSGLGTFEKVYPLFENAQVVPATYVNHAHNEFLQISLELGVPGMALIAVSLFWLVFTASRVWFTGAEFGSLLRAKMAASVSIFVPIFHSLLDYPMRTQAVACLAAACLGILVAVREKGAAKQAEVRADVRPDASGEPPGETSPVVEDQ